MLELPPKEYWKNKLHYYYGKSDTIDDDYVYHACKLDHNSKKERYTIFWGH